MVTVTTPPGTATSPTDLCSESGALDVAGVWPNVVTEGRWTSIFLFGLGFERVLGVTEVAISGITQSIMAELNPTMLMVRTLVTDAVNNGPVTVMTPDGTVDVDGSKGVFGEAVLGDKCLTYVRYFRIKFGKLYTLGAWLNDFELLTN